MPFINGIGYGLELSSSAKSWELGLCFFKYLPEVRDTIQKHSANRLSDERLHST